MDPLIVIAVCAIVITVLALASGVALIITMFQIKETARRAEDLSRRLEPTISELELLVREWRQVGEHISATAENAERISAQLETVGSKAAQASSFILGGIGGPVGRTFSVFNAIRTGADVFFRLTGRNQKSKTSGENSNSSGRKSESKVNKEVAHEQ